MEPNIETKPKVSFSLSAKHLKLIGAVVGVIVLGYAIFWSVERVYDIKNLQTSVDTQGQVMVNVINALVGEGILHITTSTQQ